MEQPAVALFALQPSLVQPMPLEASMEAWRCAVVEIGAEVGKMNQV